MQFLSWMFGVAVSIGNGRVNRKQCIEGVAHS